MAIKSHSLYYTTNRLRLYLFCRARGINLLFTDDFDHKMANGISDMKF